MITKKYLLLFVIISFTSTFLVNAHGNLTIRINKKTSEIKLNPNNSKLYYERGFLYHQHEEYDKAIKDYKKAKKLGFTDKLLYYRTAESYYVWTKYKLALKASSKYLEIDNIDVKINKLHAQILFELNRLDEAVQYYTLFLDNVVDPRPGDFVELSSFIIASQKDYPKAIQIIDKGLEKLGENVLSLRLKKMEYLKSLLPDIEYPAILISSSNKILNALSSEYQNSTIFNADNPTGYESFLSGDKDLLLMQIASGKFGHSFTNTKSVIYIDYTFNSDDYYQSLARTKRLNSIYPVSIYHLHCLPIDKSMHNLNKNRSISVDNLMKEINSEK